LARPTAGWQNEFPGFREEGEHQMLEYTQRLAAWAMTLRTREEGQTLVEYSLITALVSVALIVALRALAVDIGDVFSKIGSALDAA
jgi:Flp pilus assembly pilin Flp